jgi:hypothetical protein
MGLSFCLGQVPFAGKQAPCADRGAGEQLKIELASSSDSSSSSSGSATKLSPCSKRLMFSPGVAAKLIARRLFEAGLPMASRCRFPPVLVPDAEDWWRLKSVALLCTTSRAGRREGRALPDAEPRLPFPYCWEREVEGLAADGRWPFEIGKRNPDSERSPAFRPRVILAAALTLGLIVSLGEDDGWKEE